MQVGFMDLGNILLDGKIGHFRDLILSINFQTNVGASKRYWKRIFSLFLTFSKYAVNRKYLWPAG